MRGFRLLASLLTFLALLAATPAVADPDIIIRFESSSTDGKMVDSSNALRSTELQVISERATAEACFTFNRPLDRSPKLNLENFVAVEPQVAIAASVRDSTLCIEGLLHGETYKIRLLSGLPGVGGKLETAEEHEVKVGSMRPSVIFASNGTVLPRLDSKGLPIQTVNVASVHIAIARINDRNLIDRVQSSGFGDWWTALTVGESQGELVWEGDLAVEKVPNRPVVTALPLTQTVGKLRPGLYFATILSADGVALRNEDDYRKKPANQWFVVSDLGLSSFVGDDGALVQVRSLKTTQPLADVDVVLIARNNKILSRARSDRQGFARFAPGMLRGKGGNRAAAIYAYGGKGEFSYIGLEGPALDLSDRGVGGRPLPGPLDVLAFSERGIYRPGETAHVTLLLRDDHGRAVEHLPLIAKLLDPTGTEVESHNLTDQGGGGYRLDLPFAVSAKSGQWTVTAQATSEGEGIGSVSFQVADFVPPRIEFDLTSPARIVAKDQPVDIDVAARFLYGAPAADLNGELSVVLRRAAKPYPSFADYQFGEEQDRGTPPVQVDPVKFKTDGEGKSDTQFTLPALPATSQPLEAVVHASLFDIGGRPVEKSMTLPVESHPYAIGIKPNFDSDYIGGDSVAGFSVIAVDPSGQRIARKGLTWVLYEVFYEWREYQSINGDWDWQRVERDSPALAGGVIDIAADQPIELSHEVGNGQFRFEVFDQDSGVVSSVAFYAGWWGDTGRSARAPDQVSLSSDRAVFAPGETTRLFVKPPYDADVLFSLVDRGVRRSFSRKISAAGADVSFDIPEDARAGIYMVATAFAAPDGKQTRLPRRAIGTYWLPIDPKVNRLDVAVDLPEVVTPRQTLTVPVSVQGAAPGEAVHVVLSAVDDGVLQLTAYQTPDPLDYFFGKQRLGVDIRDLYSTLIDPLGAKAGTVRSGGDAAPQSRQLGNAPKRNTEVVALYSGIVTVDKDGKARIPLELPDFNGRLRLMVEAWSTTKVGGMERMLTVRAPMVAELALPLYLAPGDHSTAVLSLTNLDAKPGDYFAKLVTDGPVGALGRPSAATPIRLGQGDALRAAFGLVASGPGDGKLQLEVTGPDGFSLVRNWHIAVRPQNPIDIKRQIATLPPGADFKLDWAAAAGMFRDTARLNLTVSSVPDFDAPGLVGTLSRDPYWWCSNVVSRYVPLLYNGDVYQQLGLGDKAKQKARMEEGIRDILGYQVARGTFAPGWWYLDEAEEEWLTGYVLDFMTRAREQGFEVPSLAYSRGIRWMTRFVAQDRNSDHDLGVEAYAYYVLARAHAMDAGRLRRFFEAKGKDLPTALARAQIGAALARLGDLESAKLAFDALDNSDHDLLTLVGGVSGRSLDDYASPIRDRAAVIALMAESGVVDRNRITALAVALAKEAAETRIMSAQELAWLLYLSNDLRAMAAPIAVSLDGEPAGDKASRQPVFRRFDGEADARDLLATLHNDGDAPLYLSVSAVGNPLGELPAVENGFDIKRRIVDRFGNDVDLTAIKQNDLLVVIIEGRRLNEEGGQTTVADMLPAGLEIQNVPLDAGKRTEDLAWLDELSRLQQKEYREDRFVATADISRYYWRYRGQFRMAYMVRAVTPGDYVIPGIYVEDLYRPNVFSRGPAEHLKILAD
ncbi:alpha-2-macroglobulin family protein [Dongia sp. agr-C8]